MARIGYARVSTDEQSDALEPQVARLMAAGCERVITDVESGKVDDRDGLVELLALVKARRVGEIVVTRVDRLGRHAAHADTLLALCEAQGVAVRALDGGVIETATPQGFLMARLQTGLAEMESRMLSLRVRRSFAEYRRQGRHLRKRAPFGYAKAGHQLRPDPEQWPLALRIIRELRQRGSFTAVAYGMPAWCPWTPAACNLQNWFVNPVLRGHVPHQRDLSSGKGWEQRWGEIQYDMHPALITEVDWRDLREMLRRPRNRFGGGGSEVRHGLTGLLRCDSCGHLMRRNSSGGVVWWRCRHRLCTARGGAREADVLPAVVRACVDEAERLARVAAEPQALDPAVAGMLDELATMDALSRRNPGNRALAAAVTEQRAQIEALQRVERLPPDLAPYVRAMSDPMFFIDATPEEQRALFGGVLQAVRIGVGGRPIVPVPRSC